MKQKDRSTLNKLLGPVKSRELKIRGIYPFHIINESGELRVIKMLLPFCLDYLIETENQSNIQQYHQKLSRAFFLYKWNMSDSSLAIFEEELEKVREAEHFELLLDFLRLKRAILVDNVLHLPEGVVTDCSKDIIEVYGLLSEHIPYLELHGVLLSYVVVSVRVTEEEKKIHHAKVLEMADHPLLVDGLVIKTRRTKILYRKCRSIISLFKKDLAGQIKEHKLLLTDLMNDGKLRSSHQQMYLKSCHRLGILHLTQGDHAEVKKYIDRIQELAGIDHKLEMHRIQSMIDLGLQYAYDQKNWKVLLPGVVKKLEKNYEQYETALEDEYRLIYFINVARSYFRLAQFQKAGDVLESMPPKLLRKRRADIWAVAEVIKLACMFETKNYRLLIFKAPVSYNKIRRRNYFPRSFRAVVSFFRRTNFMIIDKKQRQLKFAKLAIDLDKIYEESSEDRYLGDKLLAWNEWARTHGEK